MGMPRDMLRDRLRLDAAAYDALEGYLVAAGHVAVSQGVVRSPDHTARFTAAQEEGLRRLWRAFERDPHAPPTYAQACELADEAVVRHLIERGELARISDDVLLAPDVLREWVAFTQATLDGGGALTVAALRDHFGTTRRYALDFLDRLDAVGITRRKGDERVRGPASWDRLFTRRRGRRPGGPLRRRRTIPCSALEG